MANKKTDRGPRFLSRKGDKLKLTDAKGHKHTAHVVDLDEDLTKEQGSFTFGYCKSCDWTGRARRARDKARSDAREHRKDCDGKGKIMIGVTDHRD